MRVPIPALVVAAILALGAPALAHGGQYRSPAAPPPDDGPSKGGPGTATGDWSDWWWTHRDRYLDLRKRMRRGPLGATPTGGLGTAASGAESAAPEEAPADGGGLRETLLLPVLTRALGDPNGEVRSAAVIALGKLGFPRSLIDLQKALKDSHPDVRDGAVLALGMLKDDIALDQLREVLRDPNVEARTRGFAALAIGILGGDRAAEELLAFLAPEADADRVGGLQRTQDLRACAVFALGQARSLSAIPALRRYYASPTLLEPVARCCAGLAFARLGDPDAVPLLLKGMRHRLAILRQSAAAALGMVASPKDEEVLKVLAQTAIDDEDIGARQMSIMALGRIGGDGARTALRSLLASPHHGKDRNSIILALGIARDEKAGAPFQRIFREEKDADLRGAVAIAMGLVGRKEAVPDLREAAFGKGDPAMRGHSLTALGLLEDAGCVPAVRKVLEEEADPRLRLNAAICLALLRDDGAPAALAELARKGGSVHVRCHSCYFLGIVGDPDSARVLARIVEDPFEQMVVRMHAVAGLGVLGDHSPLPLLPGLAADSNPGLAIGPLDEVASFL